MTRSRLKALLERFARTRIGVIGDLILDEYIWGNVERISPEAPVPVVWADRESAMPGGAANVAAQIRTLGGQVRLAGVVGTDLNGSRLREVLLSRGVPVEGVLSEGSRPTSTKTRVIAHHQQVVRIDRENPAPLSPAVQKELLAVVRRWMPQVEAVIIEDYGKGLVTPGLLKPLIRLARRHGKGIFVDPKEEHLDLYRGVTALTPNKKEAALAAGMKIVDKASLREAAERIVKRLRPEALLVTLGEEGMWLFQGSGKRPVRIPTVARDVFDVSGAGDTVVAAFALARAAGASFADAARTANAAAGVVVGKVGTASCSAEELLERWR